MRLLVSLYFSMILQLAEFEAKEKEAQSSDGSPLTSQRPDPFFSMARQQLGQPKCGMKNMQEMSKPLVTEASDLKMTICLDKCHSTYVPYTGEAQDSGSQDKLIYTVDVVKLLAKAKLRT